MATPIDRNIPGARYQVIPISGVTWRELGGREWYFDDVENNRQYIWTAVQKDGSVASSARWISLPTYIDWAKARQSRLAKQQAWRTTGKVAATVGTVAVIGFGGRAIYNSIVDAKSAQDAEASGALAAYEPAETQGTPGGFLDRLSGGLNKGAATVKNIQGIFRPAVQTTPAETSKLTLVAVLLIGAVIFVIVLVSRKA